jgi:tRNA pseudouridine32 synthase/23S rRNA pseudouridine746 synthase
MAAEEVRAHIAKIHLKYEENEGKMFGVLVVRTKDNSLGFLASFSGNINNLKNQHYFVPPIYNLQKKNGFFKKGEAKLIALNDEIDEFEHSADYLHLKETYISISQEAEIAIQNAIIKSQTAKENRKKYRADTTDIIASKQSEMVRESQFLKAEIHRTKIYYRERLDAIKNRLTKYEDKISILKEKRRTSSAELQKKIFSHFLLANALGERIDILALFKTTLHKDPPAGTGECAAPKLLQYAFLHDMKPICMAEFWAGPSPKDSIRHDGSYYPACHAKCEPVLGYMMQGLDVMANPFQIGQKSVKLNQKLASLPIVYDDQWLAAINKPAGMLSVPGKNGQDSVYDFASQYFPDAAGPLIVHRLDMATSGIILVAKTKTVHAQLQKLFAERKVIKKYIAILDGQILNESGVINLPISADERDMPRRMIDLKNGKSATTEYRVLKRMGDRTLVEFTPITGRTHQIRVHAAHQLGLNAPIVGDTLYGEVADRLYLQAYYLEFRHPVTENMIQLSIQPEF